MVIAFIAGAAMFGFGVLIGASLIQSNTIKVMDHILKGNDVG